MGDLFRETLFGHTVRWLTRNRVLQYPEERTNFEVPPGLRTSNRFDAARTDEQSSRSADSTPPRISEEKARQRGAYSEGAFRSSHLTKEECHTAESSTQITELFGRMVLHRGPC